MVGKMLGTSMRAPKASTLTVMSDRKIEISDRSFKPCRESFNISVAIPSNLSVTVEREVRIGGLVLHPQIGSVML
jgi:hypothetical protein